MRRTLFLAFLFLPGIAFAQQTGSARWEKTIAAFEAKDRESAPAKNAFLFAGSSSIRLWDLKKSFPDLPVVNRGFGGSQIADSTHFADRIIFPHTPKAIILYAGDNDVAGGKSAERVFADYRAFVKKVRSHLPEVHILYIAIKPSVKRWTLWPKMNEANERIREFTEKDDGQVFVDIATPMLGEDGQPRKELFAKDGLHLNETGYALWTSVLRPLLQTK